MTKSVQNRLEITLEETKHYLRIEHNKDDNFINDLIDAAKEQADLFLQNDFKEQNEAGEWVEKPIPFSVKLAVLKQVAAWYEIKTEKGTAELGDLGWDSKKLMSPYRKLVGL